MVYPITVTGQTFTVANTYCPNTANLKTDGSSSLAFDGPNLSDTASISTDSILPITVVSCSIDGGSIIWGAKQSQVFGITYSDCTFENGSERSFDMVRGGWLTFNNCKFTNTAGDRKRVTSPYFSLSQMCDIGLKGGIHDITFNNCSLNDVLLGDYCIYDQIDRPKVRRVTFNNCVNPNGGPIIVRARYFDGNTIVKNNTSVNAWTWPAFVTSIYWWYNRHWGDTRKPAGWNVILPLETV